jgi:hypothetical protein
VTVNSRRFSRLCACKLGYSCPSPRHGQALLVSRFVTSSRLRRRQLAECGMISRLGFIQVDTRSFRPFMELLDRLPVRSLGKGSIRRKYPSTQILRSSASFYFEVHLKELCCFVTHSFRRSTGSGLCRKT